MSKDSDNDNKKPAEVLQAEKTGGEVFDPTDPKHDEPTVAELQAEGKCVDCKGLGIRDPQATQVCPTCQGTGKA